MDGAVLTAARCTFQARTPIRQASPRHCPGCCTPAWSSSTASPCSPSVRTPAEGLYLLVYRAYEKRSLAITSALHPAAFHELMPQELTAAIADWLLQHADVRQTSGDSVRLSQALARQGVMPLA